MTQQSDDHQSASMAENHPSNGTQQGENSSAHIKGLQEQVTKLTDIAARAQADLLNYKDRAKRDAADLRIFALMPLVLALLSLWDDLQRAVEHHGAEESIFQQLLSKLEKILSDAGVTRIASLGKKLDPARHEVLQAAPGKKDVILAVHEEGFEMQGKILRPAKVQVGDGQEK